MNITEKDFPVNVQKVKLAEVLNMSVSTLQTMLNRKYIDELKALGYCPRSKVVSRKILLFLCDKIALLPEDFK